jgi:hypothetical protein
MARDDSACMRCSLTVYCGAPAAPGAAPKARPTVGGFVSAGGRPNGCCGAWPLASCKPILAGGDSARRLQPVTQPKNWLIWVPDEHWRLHILTHHGRNCALMLGAGPQCMTCPIREFGRHCQHIMKTRFRDMWEST